MLQTTDTFIWLVVSDQFDELAVLFGGVTLGSRRGGQRQG